MMNTLVFQVLTVLVVAASPAPPENPLLTELLEKGVKMPDGQVVPLPAVMMAEGLNATQQAAVLSAVAPRGRVEEFLDKGSNAPTSLKVGKRAAGKDGTDVIRTVNLYFVVYGDWNVLTSDQFSKGILKEGKSNNENKNGMVVKAGYLKPAELTLSGRRLSTRSTPDLKEYFLYTTLKLFDRVELSATRFGVATKTPTGVIVAAKVDSRFAKDKEYPNQWNQIIRGAGVVPVLGPPERYCGAAFYAKVTRLLKPDNAIFVEFHQVFYEPRAWFGEDENLMPTELRKIIPFQVKQFRIKLAKATIEEEQRRQAEEKPGEATAEQK